MTNKLFGMSWHRQTKDSLKLLGDANIVFDTLYLDASPTTSKILESIAGKEVKIPALFVDGVLYGGLEGVRRYISEN